VINYKESVVQKIKTKFIITLLFILCTFYYFCDPNTALAGEISGKGNDLDVVFVVDVSGSMKSNDPGGIALDMVKAFVDTVHIQNIRVGFVAYNDMIVSSLSPISITEIASRNNLKELIDQTVYSGNTDIGLGLMSAYQSMPKEEGRNRIIVLISDGESDLRGSNTGRTIEKSNQDLFLAVDKCIEEEVPIYTIAFGNYDGSKVMLEDIAKRTGASTYLAASPELIIEVLYDILGNNLSYKIQKISTGIYARGSQEIRCVLDEVYLNEVNILLISPQMIGESKVLYNESQISLTKTSYYAVGKIEEHQINREIKDLSVTIDTEEGQQLDIYVISYRDLEPVLNIETKLSRNQEYPYEVYFKEKDGFVIRDDVFYQTFKWDMDIVDSSQNLLEVEQNGEVKDGVLQGSVVFNKSGNYLFSGKIHDNLGAYQFSASLIVENTPPTGGIAEKEYTILSNVDTLVLNEYFTDAEDDKLEYSLQESNGENVALFLENGILTITPLKSGLHTTTLLISDGEEVFTSQISIQVRPLWQVYWWVIVIILLIVAVILYKVLNRSKEEPQTIRDIKSHNDFTGRLDLYFIALPKGREIPPLVFHMYRVKGGKIRLGDLLTDYEEEVEQLDLSQIYFVADEERKMILFHKSDASIMIGNSIACKQIRYSISFGDVIYITSPEGTYDLELRYISMIQ
jgi:Mg-chelatase subunit ChlD